MNLIDSKMSEQIKSFKNKCYEVKLVYKDNQLYCTSSSIKPNSYAAVLLYCTVTGKIIFKYKYQHNIYGEYDNMICSDVSHINIDKTKEHYMYNATNKNIDRLVDNIPDTIPLTGTSFILSTFSDILTAYYFEPNTYVHNNSDTVYIHKNIKFQPQTTTVIYGRCLNVSSDTHIYRKSYLENICYKDLPYDDNKDYIPATLIYGGKPMLNSLTKTNWVRAIDHLVTDTLYYVPTIDNCFHFKNGAGQMFKYNNDGMRKLIPYISNSKISGTFTYYPTGAKNINWVLIPYQTKDINLSYAICESDDSYCSNDEDS